MEWYLKVVKNYVGFKGRARRKEYWMFTLFSSIISIILMILDSVLHLPSLLNGIYSLAVFLPGIAVGARRLHDTGRSGWWQLLPLIPLVGFIILLVFFCKDSQENENQYGPNPKRLVA